jgi:integrase
MIRPCLQDLAGQGFTLEDAKRLLGHSSIVLTSNTYGHVLEQRQVAMAMDAVLSGERAGSSAVRTGDF